MTMPLDYAKVVGRFAVVRGDTSDPGTDPDTVYCNGGTVTFTPVARTFRVADADPDPLTIVAAPVVAQIGTDGRLELNSVDEVWLLDLGSDQLNPQIARTAAAYTVTFADVTADGQAVTLDPFGFHPVPGEDNDLTLLAPFKVAASVPITRGPKGDKGDAGPKGDTGATGIAIDDQVNFVDLIRAHGPRYTRARLVKTATNGYQVRLDDGVRGAVYGFVKDTNDDFIKVDGCYTGYGDALTYSGLLVNPTDLTGTWNAGSLSTTSWYTTAVGATFTKTIAGGDRIDLRVTRATNGGMWSVTVDGGPAVLVSCQSTNPAAVDLPTIASGLNPNVSHTVVGTFLGNDPGYAPVGTARGWIRVIDTASPTVGGYVGSGVATTLVLGNVSNKEMAFDMRSTTVPAQRNWHPEHNAVGSMTAQTPAVFYVDGVAVNVGAMAVGASVPITKSFELDQYCRGRLAAITTPATGAVDVMDYRTRHVIGLDGVIGFNGRAVCLSAVEMVTGFPMMLPGYGPTGTTQFVSGVLNSLTSPLDESTTFFAAEGDAVFSAAVLGSSVPNVIGAAALRNPRLAFRRGKSSVPPAGQRQYVWNRATYPKYYFAAFLNKFLAPGDAYSWACDIAVADIPDARKIITAAA